jgi:hypothetical protein
MPFQVDNEGSVSIEKEIFSYITSTKTIETQANSMANSIFAVLSKTRFEIIANELVVFEPFKTFVRDIHYAFMESRIDSILYDKKNNEIVVMDIKSRIGSTTQYKVGDIKHIRQLIIYAWLLFTNYHILADSLMIFYVNRSNHVITVKIPLYETLQSTQRKTRSSTKKINSKRLFASISNLLECYYEIPGQYMDDTVLTESWPLKHKNEGRSSSITNPILSLLHFNSYLKAFKTREKVVLRSLHDWKLELKSSKENAKLFFKDKMVEGLNDTISHWRSENYNKRITLFSQGNHLFTWKAIDINVTAHNRKIDSDIVNFGNSSLLNYSRTYRENLEDENLRQIGHQKMRNDLNAEIATRCDQIHISSLISPEKLWNILLKKLCYDKNESISITSKLPTKFHTPLFENKDFEMYNENMSEEILEKIHKQILYRFVHRSINSCLIHEIIAKKAKMSLKEHSEYIAEYGHSQKGNSFVAPYPRDLIAWRHNDRDFCSGSRRQSWSYTQLNKAKNIYLPHVINRLIDVLC